MTHLRKMVGAAMIVIAGSGSFSHALDIEKCLDAKEAVMMAPHGWESDYKNLGNSLISYSSAFSYEGLGGWAVVGLVQCRTGETLTVGEDGKNSLPKGYETLEAVSMLVQKYVVGAKSYSFPALKAELQSKGFAVGLETSSEEICPCKAFYPQDRGKKKPYVFQSGFAD